MQSLALPKEAIVLNQHFPLSEILNLRMCAWYTINPTFKNITNPKDWGDKFDNHSIHIGVMSADKGVSKLIAATRVTILHQVEDLTYYKDCRQYLSLLPSVPFAYISRMVVHPQHRGQGLSHLLDIAEVNEAKAQGCKFVIGFAFARRVISLKNIGFKSIGKCPRVCTSTSNLRDRALLQCSPSTEIMVLEL
ncbi:hypothetical protein M23134_04814 [Microscilla marina ATCC 23134]|uniref:N-acetyltransferase domain-containing protein n=2 Tax=Microscilla marina TaxID=1027 RepID=A1ZRX6_MICM2|nr:hypothetical protein M23134_04814 [Microscilla marina ATCC 23134]